MSLSPDELGILGEQLFDVGKSLRTLGESLTELEHVFKRNTPVLQGAGDGNVNDEEEAEATDQSSDESLNEVGHPVNTLLDVNGPVESFLNKLPKNKKIDLLFQQDSNKASVCDEKNEKHSADVSAGNSSKNEKKRKSLKFTMSCRSTCDEENWNFPNIVKPLFLKAWAAMQNCKKEKGLASNIRLEVSNLFYRFLVAD